MRKGSTIDEAIYREPNYSWPRIRCTDVKFVLAGGTIGTTAALNDEVAYSDRVSTILIVSGGLRVGDDSVTCRLSRAAWSW